MPEQGCALAEADQGKDRRSGMGGVGSHQDGKKRLADDGQAEVREGYARLAAQVGAEAEAPLLADGPLETPVESDVVHTAQRVLISLGLPVAAMGVPFGSDASKLARQGVPSIIYGPGSIDRAHAAVEYVETDQVLTAAAFYRQFITEFPA